MEVKEEFGPAPGGEEAGWAKQNVSFLCRGFFLIVLFGGLGGRSGSSSVTALPVGDGTWIYLEKPTKQRRNRCHGLLGGLQIQEYKQTNQKPTCGNEKKLPYSNKKRLPYTERGTRHKPKTKREEEAIHHKNAEKKPRTDYACHPWLGASQTS